MACVYHGSRVPLSSASVCRVMLVPYSACLLRPNYRLMCYIFSRKASFLSFMHSHRKMMAAREEEENRAEVESTVEKAPSAETSSSK